MSACNIILEPTAAHLITDAAALDDDGRVAWLGSKVLCLPYLKAAISCRGRIYAQTDLRREIEHRAPRDITELVAALPDMLMAATMIARAAYRLTDAEASATAGLIGWWDGGNRPVGYLLASDNLWVPEPYAPWSMQPVRRLVAPGVPGGDGILDAAVGVMEAAPALLEAQRRDPYAMPGQKLQHRVGGFGEVTTITAEGITQTRVRDWPDQIGRPISLALGHGLVPQGRGALA